MDNRTLYFALWAEDINQYMHTGYNSKRLSEIEYNLRDYVSVDETGEENHENLNLYDLVVMTGLALDYSETPFEYLDEMNHETSHYRKGNLVNVSFLR